MESVVTTKMKGCVLDKNEAIKAVTSVLHDILDEEFDLGAETELIGGDAILDSMKLVQVCVALEDVAEEIGFEFDWTSEDAMSRSQSMFRTIESLSDEFARQSEV